MKPKHSGSLTGAKVRVAPHATCSRGFVHSHVGKHGVVLGMTMSRQQWRVHMAEDGAAISLPRRMLEVVEHASTTRVRDASDVEGRRMDERLAIASTKRICAASTAAGYSDAWRLLPARPGADDHAQHPSRIGNRRVWPDGRQEVVA